MAKRITLPQLKKYDVTQKVIEMLADAESRAIIFSIIRRGKTAAELSEKHKIPLSSVYKKISDLDLGIDPPCSPIIRLLPFSTCRAIQFLNTSSP